MTDAQSESGPGALATGLDEQPDDTDLDRSAAQAPPDHRTWTAKRHRRGVIGASLLFLGVCLGFLVNTPAGLGPDELFHLDRVIAAANGDLVPAPGEIFMSKGVRNIERNFTVSLMRRGGPSWAEFTASTRDSRPTLAELGGNTRSSARDWPNYMAQHPPLYYAVMGTLVALTPQFEEFPGDAIYLWVRVFNVLLILPLPLLFAAAARQLVPGSPIATAAAFLPLLIPGLARGAATINNDNLAILIGAGVIVLCVRVLRGDDGLRTALALSALAVLGSLTKATVLTTLILIPIAYVSLAVRRRAMPELRVTAVLVGGALVACAWWIRNLMVDGALIPEAAAWGAQHGRVTGEVRAPDVPMDMDRFWSVVALFPSRTIASLGLHEPPKLPPLMVWTVSVAIMVSFVVAVRVMRGRRWDVIVLFTIPMVQLMLVLLTAFNHYRHYLGLPGIQGRYVYPALFGLVFPIAVSMAAALGRHRRWTPLLIAAPGMLISSWALYTSVEYTWLVRGTALVPSNWWPAFKTLGSFFPLSPGWTACLALTIAGAFLCGIGLTVHTCIAHDGRMARSVLHR